MKRSRLVVVAGSLALALSFLPACEGEGEPRSVTRLVEASDVAHEEGSQTLVGRELLIALALAKNFHHRAKVYMADGNLDEAVASVRAILSLQFPLHAPEAEDVRHDARALLAKLMMSKGDLEEAARIVDEGLAGATRESFFVANLFTVKGEILEAAAKAVDPGSPQNEAKAAMLRRQSIEAFDRSIDINKAIQKQLLGGGR